MLEFDGERIERFAIVRDGLDRLVGWRGQSFRLARAAALDVDSIGGRAAARLATPAWRRPCQAR